ncbi:LPXTG cell wall anchor domain-containing protein [Lactobacillus sp. Marseille-P7033]|nr:LPXTG cell wall anchor domain-containing protein [Lactobacillus sp. Marseille-P7033]NGC78659.1 LPXTG cell wall anchor domain-containing protein [Limosilactobacillus reuteri]
MKKNIRHILYTSMALGVTLTAVATINTDKASADSSDQPQAVQTTPPGNNTGSDQQTINTTELDQIAAQKQAQYEQAEEPIVNQASAANHGLGPGSKIGSFTQKPTSQFSPALAQKLYEANDAHNEAVTKSVESYNNTDTSQLDHTISMVSNLTYKDSPDSFLINDSDTPSLKRTNFTNVPQDDQFYIDWLDHEIKLVQGEKESYQVPAEFTNLVNKFYNIGHYYGGDSVKISDSDYTRFDGLPGFEEWDNMTTQEFLPLQNYIGKSKYDVEFYTPYLTTLINKWEKQHTQLQQEYAAKQDKTSKNSEPAEVAKSTDQPAQPATPTTSPVHQNVEKPTETTTINHTDTQVVKPITNKATTAPVHQMITKTNTTSITGQTTVNQQVLPQTGNNSKNTAIILGLSLSTLAAMFGLMRKRQY